MFDSPMDRAMDFVMGKIVLPMLAMIALFLCLGMLVGGIGALLGYVDLSETHPPEGQVGYYEYRQVWTGKSMTTDYIWHPLPQNLRMGGK